MGPALQELRHSFPESVVGLQPPSLGAWQKQLARAQGPFCLQQLVEDPANESDAWGPGNSHKTSSTKASGCFYDPTVPSLTWECGAPGHSHGIELWLGFRSREKSGSRSSDSRFRPPSRPSSGRVRPGPDFAPLSLTRGHRHSQRRPAIGLGLDQVNEEPSARGRRAEPDG